MILGFRSDYAHSMVAENKLVISYLITDESAKLPKLYAEHVVSYYIVYVNIVYYFRDIFSRLLSM